jgi:hypothetical protein
MIWETEMQPLVVAVVVEVVAVEAVGAAGAAVGEAVVGAR